MENCGLTRKELGLYVRQIMTEVMDSLDGSAEGIIYKGVQSKINNYILLDKPFDEDFYEDIKTYIHLSSSILDKMYEHSEESNDDSVFGFFYGIIETLNSYEDWGFKEPAGIK